MSKENRVVDEGSWKFGGPENSCGGNVQAGANLVVLLDQSLVADTVAARHLQNNPRRSYS